MVNTRCDFGGYGGRSSRGEEVEGVLYLSSSGRSGRFGSISFGRSVLLLLFSRGGFDSEFSSHWNMGAGGSNGGCMEDDYLSYVGESSALTGFVGPGLCCS